MVFDCHVYGVRNVLGFLSFLFHINLCVVLIITTDILIPCSVYDIDAAGGDMLGYGTEITG